MPGIVVGSTLAKQLDVDLGDCVQVTSPQIGISFGARARARPSRSSSASSRSSRPGFDQYDSKLVYTDLYEAQAFYEHGDSVTGVEMKVDDIDQAARHREARSTRVLDNGIYHTMDWQELNHGLFTALLIQQIGMSFVLALIILVAAFTVIATLIMVVLEKKKEIALLKAIGAKRRRDPAHLPLPGRDHRRRRARRSGFSSAGVVLQGARSRTASRSTRRCISSRSSRCRATREFVITGAVAIVICLVATIFPALVRGAAAAGGRPARRVSASALGARVRYRARSHGVTDV